MAIAGTTPNTALPAPHCSAPRAASQTHWPVPARLAPVSETIMAHGL